MFSFRHWSVSRKFFLDILPLFLLFIALSVALNNYCQEREMMEQAQIAAHTYADIIKEAMVSMMVTNLEVDESFLDRLGSLSEFDTLHILINDLHLREEVLTPKNRQRIETRHKTLPPHDDVEREVLRTGQPKFTRQGEHFRGVVPFNATSVCQKCHAVPFGYTLGATDLYISLSQISKAAQGNWKRSFIIFVGFTFFAFVIASVMFARFVSRPVDRLVNATTEISIGNLDYTIAHEEGGEAAKSNDELEFLSLKFDEMRESLNWRGNIRELENLIKRAMIKTTGDTIMKIELPTNEHQPAIAKEAMADVDLNTPYKDYINAIVRDAEEKYLVRMLRLYKGNINQIAKLMDIDRKTVYRKMSEYSIDPTTFREAS